MEVTKVPKKIITVIEPKRSMTVDKEKYRQKRERIEQTQLVEKLDEILERIDNEDIGFVITENGLPDMVLIPFRWFAENFPDEVPDGLRSAD